MFSKKIIKLMEMLENPDHPLLGPNLKGLYWFGLWRYATKFRNFLFSFLHFCSIIFVATQFIELYHMRGDLNEALMNLSVTALSLVSICKTLFFVSMHSKWSEVVHLISEEEISAIKKNDAATMKIMEQYKTYSRTITYFFWIIVFSTNVVTIISPALKYVSVSEYRDDIANGTEPYPHILSSWVPFNKNKMPGYLVITLIHIWMTCQGAGIIAVYDTNAVSIMAFLRGQAMIIKEKCSKIFGEEEPICEKEVFNRIRECHRHHKVLKNVYQKANTVLSPVMFIYVLVCSITICCSVVQLSLGVTTTQKMCVIEYIAAQAFQLFLYCWHSNEVALAIDAISCGIFESNWWRSSYKEKKLLLLLIGNVEPSSIFTAGPFTILSVSTFIEIIKGSYSFYTLFTQMQENGST